MCKSNRKFTNVRLAGEFLCLVNRVLKTITFNALIFCIGLALGYVLIATKVHYYAIRNNNYQYIQELEYRVKELATMDEQYTHKQQQTIDLIKQFKLKLSHDEHHECESTLGSIIFK